MGGWVGATIYRRLSVASSRECLVDVGQCQIPLFVEGCHIADAIAAYPFRPSYPHLFKQDSNILSTIPLDPVSIGFHSLMLSKKKNIRKIEQVISYSI